MKNPKLLLFFFILFYLVIRLSLLYYAYDFNILGQFTEFKDSDPSANWEWSAQILKGDLFGKDTYHPYNKWMEPIGPPAFWEKLWGDKCIFQQDPFYVYFLAFIRFIFNDNLLLIYLIHILTGLFSSLLIYKIAENIFGLRIALISYFLLTIFTSLILYEFTFQRTILIFFANCFFLYLLLKNRSDLKYQLFCCFFSGFSLLISMNLIFFIFIFVFYFLKQLFKNKHFFPNTYKIMVYFIFFLLGLSPVLIRNLIIDCKLFSFSNRGIEAIILGHGFNGSSNQLFFSAEMAELLKKSTSIFNAFINSINSHPDFESYFFLQAEKIIAFFTPFEIPNNENLFFLSDLFPILNFLLSVKIVIILGILGFALYVSEYVKGIKKSHKLITSHKLFFLWFLSYSLVLLITTILTRYRFPVLIIFIIFAAYFIDFLICSKKRIKFLILSLVVFVTLFFCFNLLFGKSRSFNRPAEYLLADKINFEKRNYYNSCQITSWLVQKNQINFFTINEKGNFYKLNGFRCMQAGEIPVSIESLKNALKNVEEKKSGEIHLVLGNLYLLSETQNKDKSLFHLKKAFELIPDKSVQNSILQKIERIK